MIHMTHTLIEIIGSEGDNSYWDGYCTYSEFLCLKQIEKEMKSSGYAPRFIVHDVDAEAAEGKKRVEEYEKKQIEKACGLDTPTKSAMQIAFEKAAAKREG